MENVLNYADATGLRYNENEDKYYAIFEEDNKKVEMEIKNNDGLQAAVQGIVNKYEIEVLENENFTLKTLAERANEKEPGTVIIEQKKVATQNINDSIQLPAGVKNLKINKKIAILVITGAVLVATALQFGPNLVNLFTGNKVSDTDATTGTYVSDTDATEKENVEEENTNSNNITDEQRRVALANLEVKRWNSKLEHFQQNPSESIEKNDTNNNSGFIPPKYDIVEHPEEEIIPESTPMPEVEQETPTITNPETDDTYTKDDENNTLTNNNTGEEHNIDQSFDLETGKEETFPTLVTPTPAPATPEPETTPGTSTEVGSGNEYKPVKGGVVSVKDNDFIPTDEESWDNIGSVQTENGAMDIVIPPSTTIDNSTTLGGRSR